MVMAFSKDYRARIVKQITKRYKSFWHSMHPRCFTSRELYKVGFTTDEWAALILLRGRRKEVIDSGWSWTYELDFSQMQDRPEHLPKHPILTFRNKTGWPDITVKEKQFPADKQKMLRDWVIIAYQYESDSNILATKLNDLVRQTWDHANDRNVAQVNTPGTLYRVWPELLPFLESEDRHVLRNKKVKSPLPKGWDESMLMEFHYGPAMERISYALTVMSLIPKEHDEKYPQLS
jgi:hypothetical protein